LTPSTYRLSVEQRGFSLYVKDKLVLEVGQSLSVNAALQLGSETQRVDVQADAVALATEDAVTGQEIDRKLINDLPLLGPWSIRSRLAGAWHSWSRGWRRRREQLHFQWQPQLDGRHPDGWRDRDEF
jgi:hypothetical protein